MLTKSQVERLKEIKAMREAARARGDWSEVLRLFEDERWVIRAG
jgi:hypothetical protein